MQPEQKTVPLNPFAAIGALTHALPDACLLVAAADGKVLFSNHQAQRLFGQNMQNRCIAEFATAPPLIQQSLKQFTASATATSARWELSVADKAFDLAATGARIASVSGLPAATLMVTLQNHKKAGEGLFGELSAQLASIRRERHRLLQDNRALEAGIAERTAKLQLKNTELDALNKSLSDFVSMVSHDLAGPSRRIQSFANLLKERLSGSALDEDCSEFLRYLEESAARLTLMIEGIVRLSRLKPSVANWTRVPLDELLSNVVNDVDALHEGVKVQVHHQPLGSVYGDAGQIQQLLLNLLNNAIKFRLPGKPACITVASESLPDSDQVQLSISDRGIGIHHGEFDRVLQPFLRGSGSEKQPGSGLGLAMCQRICQLHGGELWVESSTFVETGEPSGTEIRFKLPANPPSAE